MKTRRVIMVGDSIPFKLKYHGSIIQILIILLHSRSILSLSSEQLRDLSESINSHGFDGFAAEFVRVGNSENFLFRAPLPRMPSRLIFWRGDLLELVL